MARRADVTAERDVLAAENERLRAHVDSLVASLRDANANAAWFRDRLAWAESVAAHYRQAAAKATADLETVMMGGAS